MALEQRMVKVTLAAVVVALIVGSAYVGVAAFQFLSSPTSKRTVSVSGSGSVTLPPDEAQVLVGTVTQANDAQQASSANARIMDDLVARLHSLGITNDSISTVSYYISPLYVTRSNGSQTIVGYQAQHTLSVKIQNSNLNQLGAKVAQVIDSAVGAGANQVSGVQFMLSDGTLKQTTNQALQNAIQDASSKAQAMASALGLRITGVESISQGGPVYPPVYTLSVAGAEKSTPIMPGTFTLTASVQVTYSVQ